MISEEDDFETKLNEKGYAWEYDFLEISTPSVRICYKDALDVKHTIMAPIDDILHTELKLEEGKVVCAATWMLLKEPTNPVNLRRAVFPVATLNSGFILKAKEQILEQMLEAMYGRPKQVARTPNGFKRYCGAEEGTPPSVTISCSDDGLSRTESPVAREVHKSPNS